MHHQTSTISVNTAYANFARTFLPGEAVDLRETRRQAAKLVSEVSASQSMRRCGNFASCSAPLCPLDPRWAVRVTVPSDPTCTWFLEMAKEGPESQYVPEALRNEVAPALETMLCSHGTASLRVAVRRASKTGSRRRNAAQLLQVEAEEVSGPANLLH